MCRIFALQVGTPVSEAATSEPDARVDHPIPAHPVLADSQDGAVMSASAAAHRQEFGGWYAGQPAEEFAVSQLGFEFDVPAVAEHASIPEAI